ncbi:hypothetical protein ACYCAX_25700 [Pseudomonas sp. MT3]
MKKPLIATSIILTISANAAEIIKGEGGSIVLDSKPIPSIYEDITQTKDGFYRDLIQTHGVPALLTSAEADIIYTLKEANGKILIDCAIAETRSNQTDISIRNSMCDINKELDADYAELGYTYTDQRKDAVANINITSLTQHKKPLDIVKGTLGDIEIHERYKNLSQLENAARKPISRKAKTATSSPARRHS